MLIYTSTYSGPTGYRSITSVIFIRKPWVSSTPFTYAYVLFTQVTGGGGPHRAGTRWFVPSSHAELTSHACRLSDSRTLKIRHSTSVSHSHNFPQHSRTGCRAAGPRVQRFYVYLACHLKTDSTLSASHWSRQYGAMYSYCKQQNKLPSPLLLRSLNLSLSSMFTQHTLCMLSLYVYSFAYLKAFYQLHTLHGIDQQLYLNY